MAFVTSRDGTRIGYSVVGAGPAIILVDGALCWRASGPSGPLAEQLKDRFTVIPTIAAAVARAATPSPTQSDARSRTSMR